MTFDMSKMTVSLSQHLKRKNNCEMLFFPTWQRHVDTDFLLLYAPFVVFPDKLLQRLLSQSASPGSACLLDQSKYWCQGHWRESRALCRASWRCHLGSSWSEGTCFHGWGKFHYGHSNSLECISLLGSNTCYFWLSLPCKYIKVNKA